MMVMMMMMMTTTTMTLVAQMLSTSAPLLSQIIKYTFLQRVSIASYAKRCISHDRFCPTV